MRRLLLGSALSVTLCLSGHAQGLMGLDSYLTSGAPPDKFVFIGSVTPGFANLANPANIPVISKMQQVGLSMHYNGMAGLTLAQRNALFSQWASTGATYNGGSQGIAEIGQQTSYLPGYVNYGGATLAPEVDMNVGNGAGSGSTSYTASAANGDAFPGTVYKGYFAPAEVTVIEAAIDAARAAGAVNVAPVIEPNQGQEDLDDSFATSVFWAGARAIALYGGGIAIDAPSTYWTIRGAKYQAIIDQEIAWGLANGLRVTQIVSPYAQNPDAAGNKAGCGYDPAFRYNTVNLVAHERNGPGLPTSWLVENYGLPGPGCGTENDIVTDSTPNSLNDIAIMLVRSAGRSKAMIDAGMQSFPHKIAMLNSSVPTMPNGRVGSISAYEIQGLADYLATLQLGGVFNFTGTANMQNAYINGIFFAGGANAYLGNTLNPTPTTDQHSIGQLWDNGDGVVRRSHG